MIKVVTDPNADLPADLIGLYDIHIAPARIQLKSGQVRTDELDRNFLKSQLVDAPDVPRTAPLTEGEYSDIFAELLKKNDNLLFISSSSQISRVFELTGQAAKRVDPKRITVYDSRGISLWQGFHALRASQMAGEGQGMADILRVLCEVQQQSRFLSVIDDLAYLHRGGRVNLAQFMLGKVLDFKPILALNDGQLLPVGRGRGRERVFIDVQTRLLEEISGMMGIWLGIVHVDLLDMAERLAERLKSTLRPSYTLVTEAGPTVSAHAGAGAIGVTVCPAPVSQPSETKTEQ